MANPSTPNGFRFDHLNLHATADSAWQRLFGEVMGLTPGDRPPFGFPGAWLYGDADRALLHVVEAPAAQGEVLRLGHIAFRSDEGADAVLQRLRDAGLAHEVTVVPRDGDVQVFVALPGGLVIELDLPADGRDAPEFSLNAPRHE